MSLSTTQSPYMQEHTGLLADYLTTRHDSEALIIHLSPEDCALQAVADTSPPKWHLAHTTWFFETFILKPNINRYEVFHPQFESLFNSYYNAVGRPFSRPQRHLLSRPTLDEVMRYRAYVDRAMTDYMKSKIGNRDVEALIRLGINHEQQHQELLLMDIKFSLFQNPLLPTMLNTPEWHAAPSVAELTFEHFDGGLFSIGAKDSTGFHYDNESPAHDVYLAPFELATRLITNQEYLAFIDQGGYQDPALWMSDGWSWLQQSEASYHPLYWLKQSNSWFEYTLQGIKPLDLQRPVCHINYYEADAYARWVGARLPTEQEWEVAASWQQTGHGHFSDRTQWHPSGIDGQKPLKQLYGELWEWTQSSYAAYPGFKPVEGAVGEYNGKFMCNQMVLRGGACVTSTGHIRSSYRNFFYPKDRWPFTGLRLAKDGNNH